MSGNKVVTTVDVDLGDKSYPIYIGEHILPEVGVYVKKLGIGQRVMVVTNPTVRGYYGQTVVESLEQAGFIVTVGEVPDGEVYKSLESAHTLYDIAFEAGLDRHSAIIALGGGVIGDLAGFVAATYMRGIPFIQVPTTLLAQVDSSVGGKVAVNHPRGKNIIGSFYQPQMVFADINTLTTLPKREFKAGMAEVIKYGVIRDRDFFDFLEGQHLAVKNLESEAVTHVVSKSCSIKARVVEQDETEQGLRAILNYGHTFGHALEALTQYKTYVHGEALAIGMALAAETAVKTGMLSAAEAARIHGLIRLFGLPECFGGLEPQQIIESMNHDKKVVDGRIRYIMPEAIGRVTIVEDILHSTLLQVLNACIDEGE